LNRVPSLASHQISNEAQTAPTHEERKKSAFIILTISIGRFFQQAFGFPPQAEGLADGAIERLQSHIARSELGILDTHAQLLDHYICTGTEFTEAEIGRA